MCCWKEKPFSQQKRWQTFYVPGTACATCPVVHLSAHACPNLCWVWASLQQCQQGSELLPKVRFLLSGLVPALQNPLILIHRNSPTTGVETICVSALSDMTELAWSWRIIFRHLLLTEGASSPTDHISAFGSSFIMLSKVSSCIIDQAAICQTDFRVWCQSRNKVTFMQ